MCTNNKKLWSGRRLFIITVAFFLMCWEFLWLVNANEILVRHMTWYANGSTCNSLWNGLGFFSYTSELMAPFHIYCVLYFDNSKLTTVSIFCGDGVSFQKEVDIKLDHSTSCYRTHKMANAHKAVLLLHLEHFENLITLLQLFLCFVCVSYFNMIPKYFDCVNELCILWI